jgi:hypothetical protein
MSLLAAPDDDEYEEYFLTTLRRAGSDIMGRVRPYRGAGR